MSWAFVFVSKGGRIPMDISMLTATTDQDTKKPKSPKLKIERKFTVEGVNPLDDIEWVIKDAVIRGAGGKEKFRQNKVEVPATWEDNTIGIVAEKYFRVVAGVKETSARQMFSRVALWMMVNGLDQDVFTPDTAEVFYDELLYLLSHGMYAFNSPVWFNVGALEDPQCSACFIQSVDDTMESIVALQRNEVMLFKGGSGTGSNLSKLRSSWETLSRGGFSSGPVSFMRGFDAWAGITKSGGGTRRAAKLSCLNMDHPDILEQMNGMAGFITCKSDAEQQAHALYSTGKYSAEFNVAGNVYDRAWFQNANHSVRVTDEYMQAVVDDRTWATKFKNGEIHRHYSARKLYDAISEAAWVCGDPGIQFDSQTNRLHTCPNDGRINASNPCSEYLFLDDTACNLGSLNLMKFLDTDGSFSVSKFTHAVDIVITAKEIIVDASSYPTELIAKNSRRYRTLGLGFTNLGALLTFWGLPYDSDEGRKVAGAISSIMGGQAYAQSARLAEVLGPFAAYKANSAEMMKVISYHHDRAFELRTLKSSVDSIYADLFAAAEYTWVIAHKLGNSFGFRNAQTTVIAPTGTISFLMEADTTGIEPMLGVLTYKKAVGEGFLILPNNTIAPSLVRLGYSAAAVTRILQYIVDKHNIHTAPDFDIKHGPIFAEALGDWALRPEAHVDMMAAVQPFISGGISKTVNMPNKATKEDIGEIYVRAWMKGLKCVAVYRDGCKMSQPISTKIDEKKESPLLWGSRKKLLKTREGKTHSFRVGDVEGYLTANTYTDGTLGEIFVRMSKQGSFVGGIVDSFAINFSMALQSGASLDSLVDKFKGTRFDPSGFTGDSRIPIATSILDYIVRWLELEFLKSEEQISKPKEAAPPQVVAPRGIPVIDLSGNPCRTCGGLTKRTGSCYTCTSCGDTTGCG